HLKDHPDAKIEYTPKGNTPEEKKRNLNEFLELAKRLDVAQQKNITYKNFEGKDVPVFEEPKLSEEENFEQNEDEEPLEELDEEEPESSEELKVSINTPLSDPLLTASQQSALKTTKTMHLENFTNLEEEEAIQKANDILMKISNQDTNFSLKLVDNIEDLEKMKKTLGALKSNADDILNDKAHFQAAQEFMSGKFDEKIEKLSNNQQNLP
ncbi:MAG: hypothetical protein ACNA7Y_05985, partial [Gammaproteobacteria bacterium]